MERFKYFPKFHYYTYSAGKVLNAFRAWEPEILFGKTKHARSLSIFVEVELLQFKEDLKSMNNCEKAVFPKSLRVKKNFANSIYFLKKNLI